LGNWMELLPMFSMMFFFGHVLRIS
jgi:hypothetical protein